MIRIDISLVHIFVFFPFLFYRLKKRWSKQKKSRVFHSIFFEACEWVDYNVFGFDLHAFSLFFSYFPIVVCLQLSSEPSKDHYVGSHVRKQWFIRINLKVTRRQENDAQFVNSIYSKKMWNSRNKRRRRIIQTKTSASTEQKWEKCLFVTRSNQRWYGEVSFIKNPR